MIVRDKEILLSNIQRESVLLEAELPSDILHQIKNQQFHLLELESLAQYRTLYRYIKQLQESANEIVEIWDDFLAGHCHEFALALHLLFDYKVGIIQGTSKGIFGEELTHLFHAFAINAQGDAFDIEGKYDYESAVTQYGVHPNPRTGNVADSVELRMYDSMNSLYKELDFIEFQEVYIQKACKRILKDPLIYFKTIRENIQLPGILVTNSDWSLSGDKFYEYKKKNRFYEQLSLMFKKQNQFNFWKAKDLHSTYLGFCASFGLGSYDFDLVQFDCSIEQRIDDKISDEQSLENIKDYFNTLNLDCFEKLLPKTHF